MSDYYVAGEAAIWVQPDGPNTMPQYLGCHGHGDIEVPEGDVTPLFCPDKTKVGAYELSKLMRGEPDVPSTSITAPVGPVLDYLEEWDCPGNIILNKMARGRRDLFTNTERTFVLYHAMRTGRTYSALASRTPGDDAESLLEVPFAFQNLYTLQALEGLAQTIGATENLLALAMCDDSRCAGDGGALTKPWDHMVATGEGAVAAEAELYITEDAGVTWTAAAADPFAVDEDIGAVCYFVMGAGVRRILVARSVTDGANPAEVAYSDDGGATWTTVNVGATVGQYILAMYAHDRYSVFAVTDDGYIYKSTDGGETWTAYEEGVIHANPYYAIDFVDRENGIAVGDGNVIARTANGGLTWAAAGAPAAQAGQDIYAVQMVTEWRWFCGYDDGELWFTEDAGDNWGERGFTGSGAGEVNGLHFLNEMIGFMVHDDGTPEGTIFRTRDGGYTWEPFATADNTGLTAVLAGDPNRVWAAGNGGVVIYGS